MAEWQAGLIQYFSNSPLREISDSFLRSAPAIPPLMQTIHLTGLAVILGSIVMLSLRLLGIAARNQAPPEMSARLFPWFVSALPVLLLSGLPFFLARPQRYLVNPVFGIKSAMFCLALVLSFWMWKQCRGLTDDNTTVMLKITSALVIFSWVMTALAGRWIAYADYLFWPG